MKNYIEITTKDFVLVTLPIENIIVAMVAIEKKNRKDRKDDREFFVELAYSTSEIIYFPFESYSEILDKIKKAETE